MHNQADKYIVYKASNKVENKVYIGATTKSVEERKVDHTQKANAGLGSYFQNALATCNPSDFTWEQIDSANDLSELAEKEKNYIIEYDSKTNGYNSDCGGGFKKNVYQYDFSGKLVETFSSLADVKAKLNYDKRRISAACTKAIPFGGSFWSYRQNDTFNVSYDNRKKTVAQYDLNGNVVSRFNSVAEASRLSKVSRTCIARCCRGERERSKGFIWKYE